jgi:predicted Zn-dependent protease
LQQGQTDKGFRLIKEAYAKLSELAEVRYHYAAALIQVGEKDKGIELLKRLLRDEKEFVGRKEAERLLLQ